MVSRLILDAGRPLDAPERATGLLPASLDRTRPATVLIVIPIRTIGASSGTPTGLADLDGLRLGQADCHYGGLTRHPLTRTFHTWHSRSKPFAIGRFIITPFLTDHSAFDAYMLLVEGAGKRVLYTGDFRRHGRKSVLDRPDDKTTRHRTSTCW